MSDDSQLRFRELQLERFRDLLAQAPFNVTAVRDPSEIEQRHIGESLALARALESAGRLPAGARVIDVGSGGGVGGVGLAHEMESGLGAEAARNPRL